MIDYEKLNPGIRKTVKLLNECGFRTVDSGDGQTREFECDRPRGYVVVRASPFDLVSDAKQILLILKKFGVEVGPVGDDELTYIQASFDPADGTAIIDISNIHDLLLKSV